MGVEIISKYKIKDIKNNILNGQLKNVKSDYILSKIFYNIIKRKSLEIFKYNKKLQNRMKLGFKDYKEFCETFTLIVIEIIPIKGEYGEFIHINKNDKLFYHIYFNDNKEETINKYEINEGDKILKIKIIIDYQVKSFENLFKWCNCIESINFKKFYRSNINNMNCMFYGCSSLKELNLTNFNTNSVTDMNYMFLGCSSLKKLNLSKFNTNNVTDMSVMFWDCSSLEELNISNFNTNNVTNMGGMFSNCSSLRELNISNFNTKKVTNMKGMFFGCSNILKNKIISENKNIKDEAFEKP